MWIKESYIDIFKDCLGRLEQGVRAVSSCLTLVSIRVTLGRELIDEKGIILL